MTTFNFWEYKEIVEAMNHVDVRDYARGGRNRDWERRTRKFKERNKQHG